MVKGVSIYVKFAATNSASTDNLKLNVSGTGAIPIKCHNGTDTITSANLPNPNNLYSGMVCHFVYDGTDWLWVGHIDTNNDISVR